MDLPSFLRPDGADTLVSVVARPRAREDAIEGVHGDAIKVRVAAPPVDGAANEAIERYMASVLGVGRSRVHVLRGAASRHKRLRVVGLDPASVAAALRAAGCPLPGAVNPARSTSTHAL